MVKAFVDSALEDFERLKNDFSSHIADQVQTLILELRFLRTFQRCNLECGDTNHGHSRKIIDIVNDALATARNDLLLSRSSYKQLDYVVPYLIEKIKFCEPKIREAYMVSLKNSSQTNSLLSVVDLVDSVLENLKDLLDSNGNLIDSVKEQILALGEKLRFMKDFAAFAAKRSTDEKKRDELLSHVKNVAVGAAHVYYLCWISRTATMMESKLKHMLCDLLQKIKPSTSDIGDMYVGILKASEQRRSEIYMAGQVVVSFVNFLLEISHHSAKDHIEALHEGLVLMLAIIMEPPQKRRGNDEVILMQTDYVIGQAASFICSFQADEKAGNIAVLKDPWLPDLLENIELVKVKLIEIHPELPEVPPFTFPRTDALGFTNFLLEKLRKLLERKADSLAFVKHQIETVLRELEFFRSFLVEITKQRNGHKELNDLLTYVTGAAYEAEHVIDSYLLTDRPVWYYFLRLSHVVRAIRHIKGKVLAVYDQLNYHVAVQNVLTASISMSSDAHNPEIDEVVVGFTHEAATIRERLIGGTRNRDIVAIVGMAGLGKTTLAKKVYSETTVRHYFYIRAWCLVSQVHQRRDLLLTILRQIIEIPADDINKMNDHDLGEELRRCLKGQKYLIVMDDLWNTTAWNDLKNYFPDDINGSRILFTSRHLDVALEAKNDYNRHSLRLFSAHQSWELLEKKLFQQEKCPTELEDLGRKIAENCKGLPLSVVVIAGLLAAERTQDWWKFVAERLSSKRVGETIHYMEEILDLSYKHLPDHLKPCFLYFGAFPEDEEIPVWKLVRLWIAEGFIHTSKLKSLEDIAEDYLSDLISRSLVLVAKRRSRGGIKTCRVHDVLHDFCVEKAKKENFLELKWGSDDANAAADGEVRRVSIYSERQRSMTFGPRVRSLLFFAIDNTRSGSSHITHTLDKFKLLKILDLGHINLGDQFPDKIVLLIHLRLLAIRGGMTSIPSSITALWNLETFLVKGLKGGVKLPDTIWEMVNLRHLHVNPGAAFILEDTELLNTTQLENLVSVSTPSLVYGKNTELIIRRLENVRKLKCSFLESWDNVGNCNRFPVLNSLSQLESLKVLYRGSMFGYPGVFSFPENLKKLTLSTFRLPWTEISTIGKLPHLEVLKLLFRAFEGQQWDMKDGEFLKLRFLKLDSLSLEWWKASENSLPCLEQLVMQRCEKLQNIPSDLGRIPTLETIEVQWCSSTASDSARQIQKEQKDMTNDWLKVFISFECKRTKTVI